MGKNEQQVSEEGTPAVVKNEESSRHRLLRKSTVIIAIVIVAVLLIGAGVYLVTNNKKEDEKSVTFTSPEIIKLSDDVGCDKGITQVEKAKPSSNKPDAITLLSYRGTCYLMLYRYEDALKEFEAMKQVYVASNDQKGQEFADSQIKIAKDALANPNPSPPRGSATNNEITPEFAKELRALDQR